MTPPDNTAVDFVEMLDEELTSCCMPEVTDTSTASSEDVVKDIHRILTGNGGPTRGLLFKLAATNVNVKLIKRDLNTIDDKVNAQVTRCDARQDEIELEEAGKKGELRYRHRITKMLWDNKGFILLIAIMAIFYVVDSLRDSSSASAAEARIVKLVNTKIEQVALKK